MLKRSRLPVSGFILLFALAACAQAADKIRVACVGNSITFGAGVENRDKNSYPVKLGGLLGDEYEVHNFGVSGATLLKKGDRPYWNESAFKNATDLAPNIVIIKLGTNDTKPQNWKSSADYPADLSAMIDHFAQLASKPKVYVCLPVPVHRDLFGIRGSVLNDELLPMLKEVTQRKEVPVIDLYSALLEVPEHFPDGVHPNAAGAELMAKAVHKALTEKTAAADK